MDEQKARKKTLKRAYKKAKGRTVLLWKVLAVVLAVVTVIATPVNIVLHMFDNTIAAFVGRPVFDSTTATSSCHDQDTAPVRITRPAAITIS